MFGVLSKSIMSHGYIKRFSSNVEISELLGKKLSDLFRQGNYTEIIKTIESSNVNTNPNLLKLKAISYSLLSEENSIKADISLKQSEFYAKRDLLNKNQLDIKKIE